MCDKIKNPRGAGRKPLGSEARTERVQLRLEPWIVHRIETLCRRTGLSKSEAIRQAILFYLTETEKQLGGQNYYDESEPRNL